MRKQWKYYQYLALLFTEVYLDRYFSNKQALLAGINQFLTNDFNFRPETWHEMPDFTDDDLNKLAFWCATGSGKTLMMHVNIKQYLYYAEKHHAKALNRILILTPNEGLSRQHIVDLQAWGFYAELFNKQSQGGMFSGKQTIEVIDVNKLAETDGDKTVAVESFEGNNLVLVDEGHKGSGGVRLKGFQYSLKRSSKLDSSFHPGNLPRGLRDIETLNIFGVRADYMDNFRKYLEDEGLPANEEVYETIQIPTINLLGETKLKVVRLKEGYDFKKSVVVHPFDFIDSTNVKIDWTPKVDAIYSDGTRTQTQTGSNKGELNTVHLNLLDWNKISYPISLIGVHRSPHLRCKHSFVFTLCPAGGQ